MYNDHKKAYQVSAGIIGAGLIFMVGFYVGKDYSIPEINKILNVGNKEAGLPVGIDFAPFWKVWNLLSDKYYATKMPTDQDRVWGAIAGLTSSMGDPYTLFMPPTEKKSFDDQIRGNFGGVGMELGMKEGKITVIKPLKGNPAEKAGIKAGDIIVKINGKTAEGQTVEDAVKQIRGKVGTSVKVTFTRVGKKASFEIELIRDTITVPTVETSTKDGVFIIRLASFSEVADGQFRVALREFIESGKDKLILDMRGNPGGYLGSAVDMASFFLPAGKMVVEEKGKDGEHKEYRSFGYNIFNENLKMVILVDQNSASAAEILAGALQEHGVAKLLGTRTFGKGSVQELVPVTDNTSLKVTIARWYTPNGRSISEGGLTADYEVKFTDDDIAKMKDVQLEAGISLLLTGHATSSVVVNVKAGQ